MCGGGDVVLRRRRVRVCLGATRRGDVDEMTSYNYRDRNPRSYEVAYQFVCMQYAMFQMIEMSTKRMDSQEHGV